MKTALRLTLSLLFCITLLVGVHSAAFAETVDSGSWGDFNWTLNDAGALTISGTGSAGGFSSNSTSAYLAYRDSIKTVVIENGITAIGDYAFTHCNKIEEISIPESVTAIGFNAFEYCSSLSSITIPESVKTVNSAAFLGCDCLTSAGPIASGCDYQFGWKTEIPDYAFYGCSNLASVTIPAGVTSIGQRAFYQNSFESIVLPSGLKTIGYGAFEQCTLLRTVSLPISLTSIDNYAFYSCNALETVFYNGRKANWEAVNIGYSNGPLFSATIIIAHGTLGDLTWTLDIDGLLSISGTGAMQDFQDEAEDAWLAWRDDITSVVIQEGVTSIGKNTFKECGVLETIQLPSGLTHIGDWAFCLSGITSVTIPDDMMTIGEGAFNSCSSLNSVTIPSTITSIGNNAFYNCMGLNVVQISDLEAWCRIAFANPGANPLACAHKLYLNGTLVTALSIPDSVTGIGKYAFYGCESLRSVTLPTNVVSFGTDAFYGCTSLNAVYIADLADWCGKLISNRHANPLYNAHDLYLDNELIAELVIPKGVTAVNAYTFCGASMTELQLPKGVTDIGDGAFSDCGSMQEIILPLSVTAVGSHAFNNCSSVSDVYYGGKQAAQWNAVAVGEENDVLNANTIHYLVAEGNCGAEGDNLEWALYDNGHFLVTGTGAMADYPTGVTPWMTRRNKITCAKIKRGVTSIGVYAFYNATKMTEARIHTTVTSIGDNAFYNCGSLEVAAIPANVTYIGESAFFNCSSLKAVVIPNGVMELGVGTFYNCGSLVSVVLPTNLTSMGDSCFSSCGSLAEIELPAELRSISNSAFSNCSALTNVVFPTFLERIEDKAFSHCSALTGVVFPAYLESIGDYAFEYCYSLTGIVFPERLESIGDRAFQYCRNLREATLTESLTSIGAYAFHYCSTLREIDIPAGVTSIGADAFFDCGELNRISVAPENLYYCDLDGILCSKDMTLLIRCPEKRSGSITIPSGVLEIADHAFAYCRSITDVSFPDGLQKIGQGAFEYCEQLTSVVIPDGVTSIGGMAFSYTGIASAVTPESLTEVWGGLFFQSAIETVGPTGSGCDWEYGWTEAIPDCAFSEDYYKDPGGWASWGSRPSHVIDIFLPDTIKSIGNYAFFNCNGLAGIIIPEGVEKIGYNAFYNCSAMTTITLPISVSNIGYDAFYECNLLTDVYYGGYQSAITENRERGWSDQNNDSLYNAVWHCAKEDSELSDWGLCGSDAYWKYDTPAKHLYIRGSGEIWSYQNAPRPWESLASQIRQVTIDNGLTSIGSKAFAECSQLTEITIPESVTSIGCDAFSGCSGMTEITIPEGVTSIESSAFYGCSGLMEITIPEGVI